MRLKIVYLKFEKKSILMATVMHCANFVIREIQVYRICRLRRVGELRIGGIEWRARVCRQVHGILWGPLFQSSFPSRFSLAVFLHGLTRSETTANKRARIEKKTAWKTLQRHVFNNIGYIDIGNRCEKSNKAGMHNRNNGLLWKLVINVKQ